MPPDPDTDTDLELMERLRGWLLRLGWCWQVMPDGAIRLLSGGDGDILGEAWDADPPSMGSWSCRISGIPPTGVKGRTRQVALLELLAAALLRWIEGLGVWNIGVRKGGEVALERRDSGRSEAGIVKNGGHWSAWGSYDETAGYDERYMADADFADRAMRVADGTGLVPGEAAATSVDDGGIVDYEQLKRTRAALEGL